VCVHRKWAFAAHVRAHVNAFTMTLLALLLQVVTSNLFPYNSNNIMFYLNTHTLTHSLSVSTGYGLPSRSRNRTSTTDVQLYFHSLSGLYLDALSCLLFQVR
jgi:hypothetical protein